MRLQRRPVLWVCAVGFIAACDSDAKDPAKDQPAKPVSESVESSDNRVQDSAQPMSGMDHSNMAGMQPSAGAKPSAPSAGGTAATAAIDHSKMNMAPSTPSSAPRNRGSADMPGMDHSKMNMGTATPGPAGRAAAPAGMQGMAGMDHGTMRTNPSRGTSRQQRGMAAAGAMAGTMAGMDHSQMAGMQSPAISAAQTADRKLQRIAATLLRDPDILRRVQADSVLRNGWSDPAVRTQISAAAGNERK